MKKVVLPLVISSLSVSSCFAMNSKDVVFFEPQPQNGNSVLYNSSSTTDEEKYASIWQTFPAGPNQWEDAFNEDAFNENTTNNQGVIDLFNSNAISHENDADTVQKNDTNSDVLTDPQTFPAELNQWEDAFNKNTTNNQGVIDLFNSNAISHENDADTNQKTNAKKDEINQNLENNQGVIDSSNSSAMLHNDADTNQETNAGNVDRASKLESIGVTLVGGVTIAALAYCGWKAFGHSSSPAKTLIDDVAVKLGQTSGKVNLSDGTFQFIKSKARAIAPKLEHIWGEVASAAGNAVYTGILALPNIVAKGVKISFEILKYLIKQTAVLLGY